MTALADRSFIITTEVSVQHIAVERSLGFEPWRFTSRGREVLLQLYRLLSPYQGAGIGYDDIAALARGSDCFTAVHQDNNGKIVGIARLEVKFKPDLHGVIHDVAVNRGYCRQGVGRQLMDTALGNARLRHLPYVTLTVKPKRVEMVQMCVHEGFHPFLYLDQTKNEGGVMHYRYDLG